MNSSMSNQSTRSSHDIDYEVGEIFELGEVLNKRNHSLVITRLSDEGGVTIPESFELRSVGRNYWFLPKVEEDDNGAAKSRQFLCIAECKEQLDEWISVLDNGDNQTIDQVSLLGEEINVEWDCQSEKLIFMP